MRSHERSERRGRVVHDLDALPQLADRPSSLRWCHRGPRLVQVLAPYLLGHDPVVTLDRAHAKDPWVSDLVRQSSGERDLRGHVDGCVRDPHGDTVTDPGRVRVPACPTHPVEVTAVLGRHLGGQAPNEGGAGWVAILVEWMCLRRGLLHRGRAQTLLRRCLESWWARRLATSWRAEIREIALLSTAPKTDTWP